MPSDVVYDAVLGSLTLKQVMNTSYSGGGNPIAGTASGSPDVDTYFGGAADPRASFSSTDIGTILGVSNICTAGLAVSAGTVTIPFQKRANKSTFAGGSSNNTISGANGLVIPNTFSVSQDDDGGMCSLDFVFQSTDGVTNPVTINASQALASQSFSAMYGLGPIVVNSTTMSEAIGFTVGTGIQVVPERHNGGLYPDRLYIVNRRPYMEIEFADFDDAQANFGSVFTAMTNATCYMRKRSGIGYVADATVQHCSFTFSTGITTTDGIQASGTGSGTVSIRLYGESLSVSAATAIS